MYKIQLKILEDIVKQLTKSNKLIKQFNEQHPIVKENRKLLKLLEDNYFV